MRNEMIFTCNTDLQWVKKKLNSVKNVRGYRTQMAKAAQCQPAYLSQVLGEKVNFTLEQADGLCAFWNFDDLQSDYWLNLVQLSRSGTHTLSKRIKDNLKKIKKQALAQEASEIKVGQQRIFKENTLKYYNNWIPSAIHMLWMIPEYQNNIKLSAQRLRISETEVSHALNLLVEIGLYELKAGKYKATQNHFHISKDSLYSSLHHKNWRAQAMQQAHNSQPQSLHYTTLYSLDQETIDKLNTMIRDFIDDCQDKIKQAPEKTIACMNIDLFEV